jgi:hypothetical protein
MLRRNGLLILGVIVLLAIGITGAFAQLNDPELMTGNTFTAGTLDLTVDGENGTITTSLSADNMDPMLDGQGVADAEFNAGCVELHNDGSLPGLLSVKVLNPISHENTVWEPEEGDSSGVEVDTTGYDQNDGSGELWDQITFQFCIDKDSGSYANGECDTGVGELVLYSNYGTPGSDYSSYYSLPLDTDLADGDNIIIEPGQTKTFCVDAVWVGDTTNWWWGGMSGMSNNMAMSDDAVFDIDFALTQFE